MQSNGQSRSFICCAHDIRFESVFRNIHTIKGSAGFLGYTTLESISHATENVLGSVRSGHIAFDSDVSESMFKSVDAIRKILKSIEDVGNDKSESYESLVSEVAALDAAKLAVAPPKTESKKSEATNPTAVAKPCDSPAVTNTETSKAVDQAKPAASIPAPPPAPAPGGTPRVIALVLGTSFAFSLWHCGAMLLLHE